MADPELQAKILGSEQQFRPQYTKLNLDELAQYTFGIPGKEGQPGTRGTLDILRDVTPEISKIDAAANTALRTADITDIEKLGERARKAFIDANPEAFAALEAAKLKGAPTDYFKDLETAMANRRIFGDVNFTPAEASMIEAMQGVNLGGYSPERAAASLLGAAPTVGSQGYGAEGYNAEGFAAQGYGSQGYDAERAQRVADVAAQTIGQGALGESLYGQAMGAAPTAASETFRRRAAEMAVSTGQLSPEELRNAQQATREAFASRGLEMSNQAIAAEAMSRAEAVRQRQAQDIQQAAALNQAYLADLNASRGFATGVYGQDLGRLQTNQDAALRSALANQAAGLQLSTADQAAINRAREFGAMSANEAARFSAAAANEAAQFGAAARNEAARFGAGARTEAARFGATAANEASRINADLMARYAMANQGAENAFSAANMAAGNEAARFAAEQASRGALANLDVEAKRRAENAAAMNRFAEFNKLNQMETLMANRAFSADQQAKALEQLRVLGSERMREMGANRAFDINLAGAYGGMSFDPMMAVLGRSSGASRAAAGERGAAAGMMEAFGGNVFDPDAGINLAMTNKANETNYLANTYASRSAMTSAALGAAGNVLGSGVTSYFDPRRKTGAAGGACWVARAVYGEFNPMWLAFREWLYTKAPKWFVKLYEKYGERFADWISDKPRIKNLIRKWMDSRIKSL
jgi:hypothetical protein